MAYNKQPKQVLHLIASPKIMTKDEYMAAVREYVHAYRERIRPDLERIERAILSGEDDIPDIEDALISELGDGLEWRYVEMPDCSDFKGKTNLTPATIYNYMRKFPHPKNKMEIAKALNISLYKMEAAFAWLRKRRVVIPVGFRQPDDLEEGQWTGYKVRVYSIRQEVVKSKATESELVLA